MMAFETDREMYWLWGEEWRAQPELGKALPEMWGGRVMGKSVLLQDCVGIAPCPLIAAGVFRVGVVWKAAVFEVSNGIVQT